MPKAEADYQSLQAELDAILLELQQGEADVDLAMKRYERGLVIIKQLQDRLKQAENQVRKLKAAHE